MHQVPTLRSKSKEHVLWLCTKVRSKTHAANSVCTPPFAPISLNIFIALAVKQFAIAVRALLTL